MWYRIISINAAEPYMVKCLTHYLYSVFFIRINVEMSVLENTQPSVSGVDSVHVYEYTHFTN